MAETTDDIGTAEEAIRSAASRVADDMRTAAEQVMEAQKQRLADLARRFAIAFRRGAEAFGDDGSVFARYADRAADEAQRLSDRVGGQSWRASLGEVEALARRQPELFFAGTLVLGYLLARLLPEPPATPEVGGR